MGSRALVAFCKAVMVKLNVNIEPVTLEQIFNRFLYHNRYNLASIQDRTKLAFIGYILCCCT
jgi:hypothetical protein